MIRNIVMVAALAGLAACGGPGTEGAGGGEGGAGAGAGGGAGGGLGTGGGTSGDLPCDVAATVGAHCLQCHDAVPSGGATFSLLSRADFAAMSAIEPSKTIGERGVIRMRQATAQMPPAPNARVPDPEIVTFDGWVMGGLQAGTCAPVNTGTGGGGGAGITYDGGTGMLPCDVAAVVNVKCRTCHGNPLSGSATFPLLDRADFLQPSLVDPTRTRAQQAVGRMHNPTNPMPPASSAQPTAPEVFAFDTWVNNGTQEGSCDPMAAQPTTCKSNSMWNYGNSGSAGMNPGLACRACHLGQNFNGQNPSHVSKTSRAYVYMGTIFAEPHAKNLCNAQPPAGGRIEILDANGNVIQTLNPNSVGNFYNSTTSQNPTVAPYTARVVANGKISTMITPQTNGDCNTCHTEQGGSNAPGRIYWP